MKKVFVVLGLCSPFLLTASYFPPYNSQPDYGSYYENDTYYYGGEPIAEESYYYGAYPMNSGMEIGEESQATYDSFFGTPQVEEGNYTQEADAGSASSRIQNQQERANQIRERANQIRENQNREKGQQPNGNGEKDSRLLDEMRKKYPNDRAATLDDAQLNKKIRDQISEGWLWRSNENLILNTRNGTVTISGVVDRPGDQEKILVQIRKIPGVRSVNSSLNLKK
jgi:osmotically-inducible protein OsmY